MAACLEYIRSDMKLVMCFSDGHNAIWTSWAFLQISTWLWAWPTSFGFESMLEGYVEHAKPKFWSKSAFLSPKSTCLGGCRFILHTLYLCYHLFHIFKEYYNFTCHVSSICGWICKLIQDLGNDCCREVPGK